MSQLLTTVGELFATYIREREATGYNAKAERSRRAYIVRFANLYRDLPLSDCRRHHLTAIILANKDRWKSPWTIGNVKAAVKAVFTWAEREEYIIKDPMRAVRVKHGPPRRAMTEDEFRALLRATGSYKIDLPRKPRPTPAARFRHVLFFLRLTGARPCEARALEWPNVNFEKSLAVLEKHKTANTTRRYKPRVLYLSPTVVRMLRWLQKHNQPGQKHVFLNTKGKPWNQSGLGLLLGRLRRRAKLSSDVCFYGLRHLFGTNAVLNGVPLKLVAELMGHTTTQMTEHYLHVSGEHEVLHKALVQAVKPPAPPNPDVPGANEAGFRLYRDDSTSSNKSGHRPSEGDAA